MSLPGYIRRAHRIISALWLLSFALALIATAAGVSSPVVTAPALVLLIILIFTGSYMLARPWVQRFRAR